MCQGRPRPQKIGALSRSWRTGHRSSTSETLARRHTTPPSRAPAGEGRTRSTRHWASYPT
eukprot:2885368-Pyramimonas_sp.AAC.1